MTEAVGVWDEAEQLIVIKRDQLSSPPAFLGTLLHEIGHALSGAPDVSREFVPDSPTCLEAPQRQPSSTRRSTSDRLRPSR